MQLRDISGNHVPPGEKGLTFPFLGTLIAVFVVLFFSLYPIMHAQAQACSSGGPGECKPSDAQKAIPVHCGDSPPGDCVTLCGSSCQCEDFFSTWGFTEAGCDYGQNGSCWGTYQYCPQGGASTVNVGGQSLTNSQFVCNAADAATCQGAQDTFAHEYMLGCWNSFSAAQKAWIAAGNTFNDGYGHTGTFTQGSALAVCGFGTGVVQAVMNELMFGTPLPAGIASLQNGNVPFLTYAYEHEYGVIPATFSDGTAPFAIPNPLCGGGGGGGGGSSCPAGQVDLSNAESIANWAVKVNNYNQGDRACFGDGPNALPGAPVPGPPSQTGYCSSYDCSSLATWIVRQIPGNSIPPAPTWPGTTYSYYGYSDGPPTTGLQPCTPGVNPVCWGFTMWDEDGITGPGHIITNLCGVEYSANCHDGCSPQITNNYGPSGSGQNMIAYYIPPGLQNLTMASCDKSCSPGVVTAGGGCNNEPPPPPPCGNPALTGQFPHDPCTLNPPPAQPGSAFKDALGKWWTAFLQALKDMTAQLYSYRIFETWQLGHMMDAQDVNKAARMEQEQRLATHEEVQPNESTCVAGSFSTGITQSSLSSTQLTQGFKQELDRRAQGAVEAPVGSPPAVVTPPGMTPALDLNTRWTQYCNEFNDPVNNNAGNNACVNPAAPQAGGMLNGDVSVEGFLLKDTINMQNPHERAAAQALLINLVQPTIQERLPDSVVLTPLGHEHILKQQHLDAVNNIAADVVASIISRRSAILDPTDQKYIDIGNQIWGMRTKLMIPDCSTILPTPDAPGVVCASKNPSYNEIMLAMTKERFIDPNYFARVQNNPGALKQEQASVDAFTTIQLQDIYKLQEQINALLAARASLKVNPDQNVIQAPAASFK